MLVQRQTPNIRTTATAHLAQTMSLLELSASELRQKIENALANNPALERVDKFYCPTCNRLLRMGSRCPTCTRPQEGTADQPIVFMSTRSDFYNPRGRKSDAQESNEEDYVASTENLMQYVLRQIAPDLEQDERLIAAHILTSLDEDGLLSVPVVEIARFRGVSLSKVNKVLNLIKNSDPLGVGSPSPQEALLVQIEALKEIKPVPETAIEAICPEGLDLLSKRKYSELAQLLGIKKSKAVEVADFISKNLNPFPARSHWGESTNRRESKLNAGVYYSPDVIISQQRKSDEAPLIVEIAMPIRGTLRINPLFIEALEKAPADKISSWKNDIEQATLLVKCIQQRNHTMVRMMELLTKMQRDFILSGDKYLKPLTRSSMAKILDLHESTVSRAVADKAVQLPNGKIIPLSKFFDRSLHIRTVLKQIIEKETKPLSDTKLAKILANQGYSVARRTVAKYRSMEGILPAHLRA